MGHTSQRSVVGKEVRGEELPGGWGEAGLLKMEGYFTCRRDDNGVRDCTGRERKTRSSAWEGLGELDLHGKVGCNKSKNTECWRAFLCFLVY